MADLGGFDFSLEFSETFATRLLSTVFTEGATPRRFTHNDAGQPGLLTTRQMPGGASSYQNYLLEIEGGYDLTLADPVVQFIGGATQSIRINFAFGLKFPRNVIGRQYDPSVNDTPLSSDPTDVKTNIIYHETYRTAPANDPYPGSGAPYTTGRVEIEFPPDQKQFGNGRRVSAITSSTDMASTVSVTFDHAIDNRLAKFVEMIVSKSFTELMRKEVDDYDISPLVGDLDAFGLAIRNPVAVRIGRSSSQNVIAFACNEFATVGDGDSKHLPLLAEDSAFSASFREAMFNSLIFALYQDGVLPRRFLLDGLPDNTGPVLLEQPRLVFLQQGLKIIFRLQVPADDVAIAVSAVVIFEQVAPGDLHVRILQSSVDVQYPGLGLDWIIDAITFHLLSAFVGGMLASMLETPVSNSLDAGLQTFLNSGALAFGFHAPIRGTKRFVEILPTSFNFKPGICTLKGQMAVV